MSKTTEHGDNIAGGIQGEDAYGRSGHLTVADVWNILDNLHSHFMDQDEAGVEGATKLMDHLESWMGALERIDTDLPL